MLKAGLYEQVINRRIADELAQTDKINKSELIDEAEASKVLANYLSEILEQSLENVKDNGGAVAGQISLVNKLVAVIQAETKEHSIGSLFVDARA
jgi:hypothetical protein